VLLGCHVKNTIGKNALVKKTSVPTVPRRDNSCRARRHYKKSGEGEEEGRRPQPAPRRHPPRGGNRANPQKKEQNKDKDKKQAGGGEGAREGGGGQRQTNSKSKRCYPPRPVRSQPAAGIPKCVGKPGGATRSMRNLKGDGLSPSIRRTNGSRMNPIAPD
jgi:hypothetical protein